MATDLKPVSEYLKAIEKELAAGNTTEHSHRSALKALLESLNPTITATNEPQHITLVGAPDFRIVRNKITTGYVECKDIGVNLDEALKTDQLQRYLKAFHNLVLTNYLEFRWFVHGKHRLTVWLGEVKNNKAKPDKDGLEKTAELLDSFLQHEPEPINNPRELAQHMARLAHLMGYIINNTLKAEIATGSLHAQLTAFQENLIPDLSIGQFADMYAQTIAYGLFAARCATNIGKDFTRQNAAYLLPKTNPFLRKLFSDIAGPGLSEELVGAVDDLTQILAQSDMEAVLKGFGKSAGKDDPVVHFYETFLKEYDPKTREMRGVYYTPLPVVSYIVRSIGHILKTRFQKPQGLADPSVLVLDPAVGTATFLYVVMQEVHDVVIKQGQTGIWNDYVAEKLLPRLFGFELLMAPYAVAHLKLGLLLKETGYQFQTDQRLSIYLTNTLEEAVKHSETMFAQWITEEANTAAEIKNTKPIMVVLGNPPYSGISANRSEVETQLLPGQTYIDHLELKLDEDAQSAVWIPVDKQATDTVKKTLKTFIGRLIEDYKIVDGKLLDERKHWLQDDYVKFIRFGQWRIENTGEGILAFITNHGYLDNPTFRGMRQSLVNTFTEIYILNLHGNKKKKEIAPDGGEDKNVFDIQQGVAIGIFVKEAGKKSPATVHYADLWGLREGKYQALFETDVNDTAWTELTPNTPFYFFVPREEKLRPEYEKGWKVTDIFPVNSTGIVTARDEFVIDFEPVPIRQRIEIFLDKNFGDAEVKEKLSLSENYAWRVSEARKQLMAVKDWESLFNKILYRPFDVRSIYYHPSVVWRTRSNVMHHLLKGNQVLCIGRAGQVTGSEQWDVIFCGSQIVDLNIFYRGGGQCFPLYLYPTESEMQFDGGQRRPNLNPEFIRAFSEKLGLKFIEDGKGDLIETFGPEDIFHYAYAVFHSPTYRTRYAEFLKIDFPRLPPTSDKELFRELTEKGAALVTLHLIESPLLNTPITKYPVEGSHEVEKVSYGEKTQRVYINKTQYFEGVPPEVWNFYIGGYQVCKKWLKDRQKAHRKLNVDDITHYQKIVVALRETIRLMAEIDSLIPSWPLE